MNRGTRKSSATCAEFGAATCGIDCEAGQRIDQRQPGRASVDRYTRNRDEIGYLRGELREDRQRAGARRNRGARERRRLCKHFVAAHVWTTEVELDCRNATNERMGFRSRVRVIIDTEQKVRRADLERL